MIDLCIMNTRRATVADLRNNFRRLSAWLENGESIEITKRGKSFAHIVPAVKSVKKPVVIDFAAQLKATWKDKFFTYEEIKKMRDIELGNFS